MDNYRFWLLISGELAAKKDVLNNQGLVKALVVIKTKEGAIVSIAPSLVFNTHAAHYEDEMQIGCACAAHLWLKALNV